MKKPLVLILIGGLLLGGLGAGTYLFIASGKATAPSPMGEEAAVSPTPAPELVAWDDPAGFTLSYPKPLTVNKHDEDKNNYAHVEFTDAGHPGNVIVWVTDLPKGVTDTASWGKRVATPSSAISFDTTLGGKEAQKILVSQPGKVMTTGIVYDGVLWYIEATLTDEAYWQPVFETLTNTFAFKPLEGEDSAPAAPDSGTVVDEEEVLE